MLPFIAAIGSGDTISSRQRAYVRHSRHIVDYLIAHFESGKARIRVCERAASNYLSIMHRA